MIRKIYEVQKVDTSPGDFTELIAEDKDMLGLNMSDLEIGSMNKQKFKKIGLEKQPSCTLSLSNRAILKWMGLYMKNSKRHHT